MNGSVFDRIFDGFTILMPVLFMVLGVWGLAVAITGKFPELKQNPDMDIKTARIAYLVLSGGALLFGGWLLYHRIFGPAQY